MYLGTSSTNTSVISTTTPPQRGKIVTDSTLGTFSGIITAVDTSCFFDGICSVTINNTKVILVQGGRGLPPTTKVGKLIGVHSVADLEKRIGDHANVYAGINLEGTRTLYGNTNYYVEVIALQK